MKKFFYRAVLVGILAILSFCLGCAEKGKDPDLLPSQIDKNKDLFPEKYQPYLLLMDDTQRHYFFKLSSDKKREKFLLKMGLKQKKFLQDNLTQGMEPKTVLQFLDSPQIREKEKSIDGQKERWIYREFAGDQSIIYTLSFRNSKLSQWELWLDN